MSNAASDFDEFWSAFPHRPRCRPKRLSRMYWQGLKPLIDGSRITPDDWPAIKYGASALRELYVEDGTDQRYWVNVGTWLFQGSWEGAIEELEARQAESRNDDQQASKRRAEAFEREGRHARAAWERANGNGHAHENVIDLPRKTGGEL